MRGVFLCGGKGSTGTGIVSGIGFGDFSARIHLHGQRSDGAVVTRVVVDHITGAFRSARPEPVDKTAGSVSSENNRDDFRGAFISDVFDTGMDSYLSSIGIPCNLYLGDNQIDLLP